METEITVTFKNDYVEVITTGGHNLDIAREIWSKAIETCIANDCYKVLGIANTTKPITVLEAYDHDVLFRELGVDLKYRIAWVEMNPTVRENYKLAETVLKNNGLPGILFDDVDEAKKWLLEQN